MRDAVAVPKSFNLRIGTGDRSVPARERAFCIRRLRSIIQSPPSCARQPAGVGGPELRLPVEELGNAPGRSWMRAGANPVGEGGADRLRAGVFPLGRRLHPQENCSPGGADRA